MDRRAAKGDLIAGTVLLAVAATGAWSLLDNPFLTGGGYAPDPGPALLPEILLALLAAGALALMAQGAARLWRKRAAARQPGVGMRGYAVPALLVLTMVAYSQTMVVVGFLETTLAFAVLWTIVIGVGEFGRPGPRALFLYLAEGVAIAAGVYAVFAWFIRVPLP